MESWDWSNNNHNNKSDETRDKKKRENILKEMEKLQSVKVRALDTKATLENLNLKGKIHNVQNDLSFGWRSIADKAKKEAKTLNKKARKALATYEEGSSVSYDQIYDCDFDAGFDVWRKFQSEWVEIRQDTDANAKRAEVADCEILKIAKEWRKWEATVDELQNNLISMPDIIAQIEIAHTQINAIGDQVLKIEKLMFDYEDTCEQLELEKKKFVEKSKLSQLVEKRQLQYQAEKDKSEMTGEECEQFARVIEKQESIEKQQIYEDAFLDQMERYIKYGELEKPIAGPVEHEKGIEELSFDEDDLNALKEFLEPEELNNVLKSQATLASRSDPVIQSSDTKDISMDNETKHPKNEDSAEKSSKSAKTSDIAATSSSEPQEGIEENTTPNVSPETEGNAERTEEQVDKSKKTEDENAQDGTEWYDAE